MQTTTCSKCKSSYSKLYGVRKGNNAALCQPCEYDTKDNNSYDWLEVMRSLKNHKDKYCIEKFNGAFDSLYNDSGMRF